MKATNYWLILLMFFNKTFYIECACPFDQEFNNLATIARTQITTKSTTRTTSTIKRTNPVTFTVDLNSIFVTLDRFNPKCPSWMKTNSKGECIFPK